METKNVLTFSEACLFCGLSASYMYRLTSTRQIPHFKPRAKLLYFERVELENWLLQNRVTTIAESETKAVNYCKTGGLK
jgi:predicted DNA-binding transcriptional regulator AlpA